MFVCLTQPHDVPQHRVKSRAIGSRCGARTHITIFSSQCGYFGFISSFFTSL